MESFPRHFICELHNPSDVCSIAVQIKLSMFILPIVFQDFKTVKMH